MNWRWLLTGALVAAGCATDAMPADPVDGREDAFLVDGKADAFGVAEGSPLAVGVLRLVNMASFDELDGPVGLDQRAARALVQHRDGVDGQLGTGDDDPYDTLVELDQTPWIGQIAFTRLAEYARDHGYVNHATGTVMQVLPGPTTARTKHASVVLPDGRIFVVGGIGDSDILSSGEVYDPATQTWSGTAPLNAGRYGATATLLDDGRVLVAGGLSSGSRYALDNAEIWNPTNDTWSDGGRFATGRFGHTATKLGDGRVLVVGGQNARDTFTAIDVVVFDPATATWTKTGVTPVGIQGHTATLLPGGKVLLVGGYNRFLKRRTRSLMTFDPTTNAVEVVGQLHTGRDGHTATLVGGDLLIAGGTSDRHSYVSESELVDLTSFEVRPAGAMAKARSGHSAATLATGSIVMVGGRDERASDGVVEVDVFDPTTKTWAVGAPLDAGRHDFVAHEFAGGVLLIGGGTRVSDAPASLLYLGGGVTPVTTPDTAVVRDWDIIDNFGEKISCGTNELVFHEALGQLVCFKGRAAENQPIGTYAWTHGGWEEIADAASSPVPPRTHHMMTYDSARGRLVMFGGQKRTGYDLDDVWEFDGAAWTQITPADAVVPPRQRLGALVYDSSRGQSVLLPGYMDGTRMLELHAWDGQRWRVLPQSNGGSHFNGRYGYTAAYDAARDRVVMFGGHANGAALPVMEYAEGAWTQGRQGGPLSGGLASATWDPVDGAIYAIGVAGRTRFHDPTGMAVWRYDGSWQTIDTPYRFDHYQWNRTIVFDGSSGSIVVGAGHLMQLGEHVAPNQRPRMGYLGRRTIYPNELLSLQVDWSDPDGQPLSVDVKGLPDGATFDEATKTFAWTPRPDQGGEHAVTFEVSDGALTDRQELVLQVEGLITYPTLPTGTIDMSSAVSMSGTVRERRRNGYERHGGSFRVECDFRGANPGRVTYTCRVVKTSQWPYDYNVVVSGQVRPDGRFGGMDLSGKIEALQWDDYEVGISSFGVRWQGGQEEWSAAGDYRGYLTRN